MKYSVFKNFFVYSCGSLLLRSISIITAPITLAVVTPTQYGLLALANNFISVVVLVIGLGLRQAFALEYFHCNSQQRAQMVNDMLIIYATVAAPLLLLAIAFYHNINQLIFVGAATPSLLFICFAICMLYFFVELFYQLLQYQCKAVQLTVIQVTIALITIACNLVGLLYLRIGIMSMLIGQLIGMCIAAAIGLTLYLKKQCHTKIKLKRAHNKIWNYIKCGLPFIPSMLCSRILASGDRWVLAHYTTLHDVGLYSLADTCGQLFQMAVLVPLASSYIPHLLQTYVKNKTNIKNIEQKNIQTMWYCMAGMAALITVGYIVGKPIALLLLPTKYHPALQYVWLLLMGYIFLMGTYFTNCLMQFYKKTWFISGVYVLPATLNVLLNILLVPYFGIYGCVLATVLSYVLYFIICLWYNRTIAQHIKK